MRAFCSHSNDPILITLPTEEVRKQRKNTRTLPPLPESVPGFAGMKNIDDMKDLKQVELEETKSTFGITEDPPLALKRTPSKHMPSIKRTPSSKNTDPSDSKPMLHPSSLEPVESEDKNSSLHVKAPSSYPTNLEDIFADIDDAGEGLVDSSLKFKVDGVFIHEDYPSSSSQR
jgi:hypothetical protein